MAEPAEPAAEAGDGRGEWGAVLDRVMPAVVELKVIAVRSFQDDQPGAHGGTGFVVDAERGLMLTNRHVCTCGPARGTATFVGCASMEELPIDIAYVDPTHDFAVLRFDPARLKRTPRAEILLDPAGCRVGEEIRVVGNDSCEKLQILSGTIARIDRNAPDLDGDYNDENTFYALAGSGSRGGSSGSPVVSRSGKAIALNAAARGGTMHALFLPLHRVQRALNAVREGLAVARGTICTALTYCSFPECLRLGVAEDFVQEAVLGTSPAPGGTFMAAAPPGGMLKVLRSIPGSAAAAVLRPGDVLLELEGRPCADFVLLEDVLDGAVGRSVKLALCRGGQRVEVDLAVQDLHTLIPHAFLELGLGVFHEVPYQTAQKHHIQRRGVYVAQAGFVFGEAVKSDAVVLAVNGTSCHELQAFEEALRGIRDKEYFSVTWMMPSNAKARRKKEVFVKMQRHWCPLRAWTLDRPTRLWTPRPLAAAEAAAEGPAAEEGEEAGKEPPAKKAKKAKQSGPLAALDKSLCTVHFRTVHNFDTDLVIAGQEEEEADTLFRRGVGIVVNAEAGLVVTDRATVPQPLGDIEVTLGGVSIGASVWFVHPLHSLVVLRLGDRPQGPFGVAAAFEDRALEAGDEAHLVGVDGRGERSCCQVNVQAVRQGEFPSNDPPRWRQRNLEAIILAEEAAEKTGSGVLCDEQGRILALYTHALAVEEGSVARLGYAIPVSVLLPVLQDVQRRSADDGLAPPTVPSLEFEVQQIDLQRLRRLPPKIRPSAEWLRKIDAAGGTALQVVGITSGGPCDGLLSEGDLLVAVDGEPVAKPQALEAQLRALRAKPGPAEGAEQAGPLRAKLSVLTRGKPRDVEVEVPLLGSDGARRLLCWHGLVLQEAPRAVRELGKAPSGVYISRVMLGSPGEADGVEGDFVLAVDGVATPTLDSIVTLGRGRPALAAPSPARAGERRHLRVETADISGRRFVATLEPDPVFWPAFETSQDAHGAWSYSERPC